MRLRKTLATISFGVIALAFATGTPARKAVAEPEARCAELGEACHCSETLDSNDLHGSPKMVTGTIQSWDPSNSTTKECGAQNSTLIGGDAATPIGEIFFQTVDETLMPAGNTVDYVLETRHGHGTFYLGAGPTSPADADSERVCARHYFRYSTDHPTIVSPTNPAGPDCERVKIADIRSRRPTQFQFGTQRIRFAPNYSACGHGVTFTTTPPGQELTFMNYEDCMTQWCRAEICCYGDLGKASGGSIACEGKITTMDGREVFFHDDSPGSPCIGDTRIPSDDVHVLDGYTQDDCWQGAGERYYSHAMVAEWENDEGQWIGAAYEIEGGQSTPPPSPPPPPGASLNTTADVNGYWATITATISDGVGPYTYIFDCTNDGNWDEPSAAPTALSTLEKVCEYDASGIYDVKTQVTDQGTNLTLEEILQVTVEGMQLGRPGRPYLVD